MTMQCYLQEAMSMHKESLATEQGRARITAALGWAATAAEPPRATALELLAAQRPREGSGARWPRRWELRG